MGYLIIIIILMICPMSNFAPGKEVTKKTFKSKDMIINDGFSNFLPEDPKRIGPKDIQELLQKVKDEYHINPTTKQEFDNMVAYVEHYDSDLNIDGINVTSQRFDQIRAKYSKNKTSPVKQNILRQEEQIEATWPETPKHKRARDKAFSLMTQFIYAARYKLQYGQALRRTYINDTHFKEGTVFAQMKTVKSHQLSMYSSMDFNLRIHYNYTMNPKKNPVPYANFASFVALYEAIRRLDVDMMDLIFLAREYQKANRTENNQTTY